jgi:hypothetical protein
MKFEELIKELKEKDSYNKFISENPSAILCAGFFILSSGEKEGDKIQINFFVPEKKRIFTFDYPFNNFMEHKEEVSKSVEIKDFNLKVDLDNLKDFLKEKFKLDAKKIIGILKDDIWNLTILDGMDMRRYKINAYSGEVVSEDKGLLSDFIKIGK